MTDNTTDHTSDAAASHASARSEMGQGVYTAMPMLIAEELNVDINKIQVAIAPPGGAYANSLLGGQITGGGDRPPFARAGKSCELPAPRPASCGSPRQPSNGA